MSGKRLQRSATEVKIAGVCGGLAEHLDADPVIVRLATVGVGLLAPPVAIVGYIAAWILMPVGASGSPPPPDAPAQGTPPSPYFAPPDAPPSEEPSYSGAPGASTPPPAEPARPARARDETSASLVGGLIVIAIGLFFLMLNLGVFDWAFFRFWRWRTLWPAVLIVLGVVPIVRGFAGSRRAGEGRGAA